MVKLHLLSIVLVSGFILIPLLGVAFGQVKLYHFEHEWAKVRINPDGTIDLLYDMNFTADSGSFTWVEIGQPQRDFTIGTAFDQYGHPLTTSDTSTSIDFKVRVYFNSSLPAGQTIRFNLTTNVANMIYEDAQNPGNVGMQFIPTWYDMDIVNLQVLVVLPAGVTTQNVTTSVNWNNTLTEDGRLAIYWERQNLSPNQQYTFGVSFPKEFVPNWVEPTPEQPPPQFPPVDIITSAPPWFSALLFLGVAVFVLSAVVFVARKLPYLAPSLSMETLGIRRGLTAVEASYLLDVKPTKIVTEILFSLLQKRAVWAESTNPSVKLRILPPFKDKTGTQETPLRFYEIDFLNAIKEDGTLDEQKLARTVMSLRDTVEEKMRGYCRRDTIDYYRKITDKAWEQVAQAGTADLASKAYDEQLLWLLLDPNYQSRTETAFRNKAFEPNPFWLWYWYSYQHYHPNPTYKPNVENLPQRGETTGKAAEIPAQTAKVPVQEAKPPTIPGSDFANNIATAVERTSNNIVGSLEKFANAIIPAPPPAAKASHEPAHHGSSCVCACAACACVCACVSCACACASGGAG